MTMETTESTLVGHIIDVRGNTMAVSLLEDEQGAAPMVTIGDEDVLVGQIGSYVLVRQAGVRVLCIVTRISEQEKLLGLMHPDGLDESPSIGTAKRGLALVPIGTIDGGGKFQRGVACYPTTGAEVHVVGSDDLKSMFEAYREQGYSVGSVAAQPAVDVCFEPNRLFGRHFALLGQTGSGKSWAVANLIQRALQVMPRAHVIVLDVHGEYCWRDQENHRRAAFQDQHYRYVDARELEIPYWLMSFAELCDLLIEHGEREAANQTAFFRDTLLELRQREKTALGLDRVTVDTPVFFPLDELVGRIEEKNREMVPGKSGNPIKGPMHGEFDRFLIRLNSKLNDVRYDFLLRPRKRRSSASLADLLRDFVGLGEPKRPVTVVDISTVPFDVRPVVAAQVGRLAFEFNFWNPLYREFPLLLICEEAHAYITREYSQQWAGARKSMERIAKEGRKYGVGLAVVSQRPHEVSETVLAQCGTFLCLRVTNPDDQTYIARLVPESQRGLVDILAGLGNAECLALGEAVPLPTRLRFHRPEPAPNSEDIDFYRQWKEGPADIDVAAVVSRWRRQER
jgi:DNA helicase HerA-like ATPase